MNNYNKMRLLIKLSVFLFSFSALASTTVKSKILPVVKKDKVFLIEKKKSSLNWKATKVKGQHVGKVNIKSGKIVFRAGELVKADFVVDMTSIDATDVKKPKWKLKLDNHLKSKDFFNVKSFSEAKLKTTSIMTAKGGGYQVLADLIIKGQSKPVNFKVQVEKTGSLFVTVDGSLVFDRTHYGIIYKSGNYFKKLGDKLIHNPVKLDFHILAKLAK